MAEENQNIIFANSDNDEKKIIRREVEKQRRSQMSILCASLRSSLPFELIKGKRSASDHIGEAVNYIQILKQKVNGLQVKRDRLKQMVNPSSLVETGIEVDDSGAVAALKCVNINPIPGGVEIAICSDFEEGSSPLSVLMEILLQEGCDVVSCVSTHANGRIFHNIKSEGKRSISDHMHEGTNYIKYLENKVKHMQAKRDKFMELSNLSSVDSESGSFTSHLPICVIVHPFSEGVQIKCSYSFKKYVCPLSRVLHIVLKEGFDVVNCTSTKTDDNRFIHTIRSEVPHMMTETNCTEMQRKLIEAISSSSLEERLSEPENC